MFLMFPPLSLNWRAKQSIIHVRARDILERPNFSPECKRRLRFVRERKMNRETPTCA